MRCFQKWYKLICICAGWHIDEICAVHIDSRPRMNSLFCGELCVVTHNELCNEVHINAENFAVNSKFACRFKASMRCVLMVIPYLLILMLLMFLFLSKTA